MTQDTQPLNCNVADIGNGYLFTWQQEMIKAEVIRIYEHKNGNVNCQLTFKTFHPDTKGDGHLLTQGYNLCSIAARSKLKDTLKVRYKPQGVTINWDEMLEVLSKATLQKLHAGEPIVELWSTSQVSDIDYKLHPLLPLNMPTIIFGEGGSGKSYLAMYLAILIAHPQSRNPYGYEPKHGRVLYLDWESYAGEINLRLKRLCAGMGLTKVGILYRKMDRNLADDVGNLEEYVTVNGIDTVVIDSLGGASSGNLNESESATKFFSALRRLNCTSIIIGHTSKDKGMQGKPSQKTVFGSAYFTNLARSVFEVIKRQDEGAHNITIGLWHRKNNVGELLEPQGFEVEFSPDDVVFTPSDVEVIAEFQGQRSAARRILEVLKGGDMTVTEIQDALELSIGTIKTNLSRLKYKNKVIKVGGKKWALRYDPDGDLPK